MENPTRIEGAILRLTAARGDACSICPSEVARELDPDWRRLMGAVREAALRLGRAGHIEVLRKGKPVDLRATEVKGVIRLRVRPAGRR